MGSCSSCLTLYLLEEETSLFAAAYNFCAAGELIRPKDSIFLTVPKESTLCFLLAKGCYKWFSFKRAQLRLRTLATCLLLIMARGLCSSQKTNECRRKQQRAVGISMVFSLLSISCALSHTQGLILRAQSALPPSDLPKLEHFTFHFWESQISPPQFLCYCLSLWPPRTPLVAGTIPLPLREEKFRKQMPLYPKHPCANAALQQLLISFQSPQEVSPHRWLLAKQDDKTHEKWHWQELFNGTPIILGPDNCPGFMGITE